MGSHLYGSSNMGLGLSQMGSQIPTLQDHNHPSGDLLRLGGTTGSQFNHLINAPSNTSSFRPASSASNQSSAFFLPSTNHNYIEEPQSSHGIMQSKPFHGLTQLPDLHNNTNASPAQPPNLFNLSFFSGSSTSSSINNNNNNNNATNNNHISSSGLFIPDQLSSANGGGEPTTLFSGNMMGDHMSSGVSSLYTNSVQNDSLLPQMSATALLQKAAQMGSTTSGNGSSLLRGFGCPSSSGSAKPDRPHLSANFGGSYGDGGGDSMSSQIENESHIQDLMNSLANGGPSMFGGAGTRGSVSPFGGHEQESEFVGFNAPRLSLEQQRHQGLCNMDEPKMRHNLAISMGGSDRLTRDFLGVGGMVRSMGGGGISQREQHHGIDMSSLDSEMKSTPSGSRSFGGGNLQ